MGGKISGQIPRLDGKALGKIRIILPNRSLLADVI